QNALHIITRSLGTLVQIAAAEQRPADRLAVTDLLGFVRQACSAQQVLEQNVGGIAALEGLTRGQLDQYQHAASPQQLQREAWRRRDGPGFRGGAFLSNRRRLRLFRLRHGNTRARHLGSYYGRCNRSFGLYRFGNLDRLHLWARQFRLGFRQQQLQPRRRRKRQLGTRQPADNLHGVEIAAT